MKEDPYFNALQVKYAYAVTCHKAQGGQWSQIFIDQGYMTEEMLGPDYFRWLYTAITRGKDRVILVGERRALCIAIKKTDTEKRGTCLANRLQALDQEFNTKGEAYGNRSFPVSGAAEKAAG